MGPKAYFYRFLKKGQNRSYLIRNASITFSALFKLHFFSSFDGLQPHEIYPVSDNKIRGC